MANDECVRLLACILYLGSSTASLAEGSTYQPGRAEPDLNIPASNAQGLRTLGLGYIRPDAQDLSVTLLQVVGVRLHAVTMQIGMNYTDLCRGFPLQSDPVQDMMEHFCCAQQTSAA